MFLSEEEGSKDLENKATLATIVSTLENISRKFDQIDSRFDAYELEWNIPLMEQKTIDDLVKALVEERLKVLGKIPENYDNLSNGGEEESLSLPSPQHNTQQKSVNSPATLAEEFGSVAKATDPDFVYVSLSKATKDDKDTKVPANGRGCRGRRTVKDEDAADKKKVVQAEAALKRKEKADDKRK
ncbi:hypothetical protein F2Q69_00060442 [Brassica cretica]|uniref:Uncharacterized protein n=1 Tax=Brassica cretica TaxID=69181 RepID=A0A8S9RBA8_BRACR|nr:hypothetical protein F2Q69_00060442 [Brassica cretica]